MDHSILTADRNTHFKVVAIALVAASLAVVVGFNGSVNDSEIVTTGAHSGGPAIKAGTPTQLATRDRSVVR